MGSYPDRPVYGMLLAFAAFASFAAMQVFGKLLGEHGYHVIEVAFFRNGLGCAGIVLWILAARRPEFLKTRRPAANMIRGLIGAVGLWFTYGAFRLMPMSETTVFLFTSSLILPVLAIVFLKDHVGIYRWGAILAGFAGVALMAQPSGQVTLYGAVIALVAAGIHAAAGIFMRQLGKTDHTFTIVFYFTLVGTLAPAAILPFVWQSPTPGDM